MHCKIMSKSNGGGGGSGGGRRPSPGRITGAAGAEQPSSAFAKISAEGARDGGGRNPSSSALSPRLADKVQTVAVGPGNGVEVLEV